MSAAPPHVAGTSPADEGAPLAAAAGTYFLLPCGYYMLRLLRKAMALEAGREHIPLLFTITFAVTLAILPAYWWIVARVRRARRIYSSRCCDGSPA